MKVYCATGNAGKLREFRLAGELLGIEVEPLPGLKSIIAPEETGGTFEDNARIKLKRKRLDMIAANHVGDGIAFDCEDNALTVIWPGGKLEVSRGPKLEVSRELIALIAKRLPPPDGTPRRGARKRRTGAALPRDRVRGRRPRRV